MDTAGSSGAAWQPEADHDYGQALLRHFVWRIRYLLLGGFMAAAVLALLISLWMRASYNASALIMVDKKGGANASFGSAASLLGLGGGDSALENEIQVIKSRSLAQDVVRGLSLDADIYDPRNPDAPLGRIDRLVRRHRNLTRQELYSRLTVTDVVVNPDRLTKKKVWLTGVKDGWSCEGKRGKDGEAVDLGALKFTPHFGRAHKPGMRYRIELLPERTALDDFNGKLAVAPVNDAATVIGVRYDHHNPFITKQVVDTVVDKYLERYRQSLTGDYDELLKYTAGEIKRTEAGLQRALDERKRYQEEKGVYVVEQQGRVGIESISALTQRRASLLMSEQQNQYLLNLLEERSPEEAAAAMQAPGMSELEAESGAFASQVRRLETERQTKTDAHPDIIELRRQVAVALSQLQNSVRANLQDIANNVEETDRQLQEARGQLNLLPAATARLALLTADIDSATAILAMLRQTEADTELRKQQTVREIHLLDPALLPGRKSSPRVGFNTILGGMLGLLLMLPVGLLLQSAQRRITTLREIRAGLGVRVLAVLPTRETRRAPWRATALPEVTRALLRRLLRLLHTEHPAAVEQSALPPLTIGVVNVASSEPNFELAWGLADAAETPAVLIDADLVDSSLTRAVAPSRIKPGLADVLAGVTALEDALVELLGGRFLLPAGTNPAGADATALDALLLRLEERFALTVISLPPPSRWPEDFPLAEDADTLLLSVPQRGCDRAELADAVAELRRRGLAVRGAVVTGYDLREDSLGEPELRFVALH
jgi:tyrosine-protein kinase Etk/Wzc